MKYSKMVLSRMGMDLLFLKAIMNYKKIVISDKSNKFVFERNEENRNFIDFFVNGAMEIPILTEAVKVKIKYLEKKEVQWNDC